LVRLHEVEPDAKKACGGRCDEQQVCTVRESSSRVANASVCFGVKFRMLSHTQPTSNAAAMGHPETIVSCHGANYATIAAVTAPASVTAITR
jgi:hypothetical protein